VKDKRRFENDSPEGKVNQRITLGSFTRQRVQDRSPGGCHGFSKNGAEKDSKRGIPTLPSGKIIGLSHPKDVEKAREITQKKSEPRPKSEALKERVKKKRQQRGGFPEGRWHGKPLERGEVFGKVAKEELCVGAQQGQVKTETT